MFIAILSDAGAASVNFLNVYSRWNELEEPREGLIIYGHEIKKSHESPREIERFCVQSQTSGPKGFVDMVEVTACGRCQVFSGKGWSYLGFESLDCILGNTYLPPWAKLAIHVEFMKLELEIDHCQRPCRT